ncbi:MAG TPA: hypothetical protein VK669_03880 [Candidatus Limnocylindrales bacterium]|nr:hypothetical protein [Candidatus Limnocylindrales bacterium]
MKQRTGIANLARRGRSARHFHHDTNELRNRLAFRFDRREAGMRTHQRRREIVTGQRGAPYIHAGKRGLTSINQRRPSSSSMHSISAPPVQRRFATALLRTNRVAWSSGLTQPAQVFPSPVVAVFSMVTASSSAPRYAAKQIETCVPFTWR